MAKRRRWRAHKNKYLITGGVVVAITLAAIGANTRGSDWSLALSHEQEVWLHALEWCESKGVKTAVNPKDLDGTPSYYSFQFKPSTFKQFGIKYGLLPKKIDDEQLRLELEDYPLQKQIVSIMINDPAVRWSREFPACES